MLEFRLVRAFNRNYNTIDRSAMNRAVIAISMVFTEIADSVEVCRWQPSKHHVMIAFRMQNTS